MLYTSNLLHYCHPTQGCVRTPSCCHSHNAMPAASVTRSTTVECSTPTLYNTTVIPLKAVSVLPADVPHTMQYLQVSLEALQLSALQLHFITLLSPYSRLCHYSLSGCHSHNTIATSVTGSTTIECSTPPLSYTTVYPLKDVSVLPPDVTHTL